MRKRQIWQTALKVSAFACMLTFAACENPIFDDPTDGGGNGGGYKPPVLDDPGKDTIIDWPKDSLPWEDPGDGKPGDGDNKPEPGDDPKPIDTLYYPL